MRYFFFLLILLVGCPEVTIYDKEYVGPKFHQGETVKFTRNNTEYYAYIINCYRYGGTSIYYDVLIKRPDKFSSVEGVSEDSLDKIDYMKFDVEVKK